MPELPEVETVKETLKNLIVGRKIQAVDVFYDGIIKDVTVNQFQEKLINQTIKDIDRLGKYLIFELNDLCLISHLRMEGKYFIKKPDEPRNKHEHIIFYLDDGLTLRYHDTRKFGTMDLREYDEVFTTNPLKKLGPEPFNKLMTKTYLKEKLSHKTIAIKTALLDQTVMAGLGNIYVDEVLYNCRLNPSLSANKLKDKDIENVIKESIKVLNKAIKLGGTTIRSYTSSLGVTGRFQNELNVHTKENEPCKECGTLIKKTKVNGRGTYYCEKCQK